MRTAILGFVAGCLLLQWQPFLPSSLLILGLFLLGCTLFVLSGYLRSQRFHRFTWLLRMLAGSVLGFCWAAFWAHHAVRQELPKIWEGRNIRVVGTVAGLPVQGDRALRFQFRIEQAFHEKEVLHDIPRRVRLSWYRSDAGTGTQALPRPEAGERWQLTVRLKRPHGNANPYGFDYEAWLLQQGIRAVGYVRSDKKLFQKNVRQDAFVWAPQNVVHRMRGWVRDHIQASMPDKAYAGILTALVIGEQRAIDRDNWEVFRRTGVSHLFAISGLHITMIAGMVAALISALWRRSFFTSAQWPLLLPAQKVAALSGASIAVLYVLLAGFGVPAQRTLYMLLVVALALWLDRLTSVTHVLLLALGVVVLMDPWAVLWPGFWLSFAAVGVILYASIGRGGHANMRQDAWLQRSRHCLMLAARTQYAVTLGLVPLILLLFGQVSLVSPLANALAIPVVSFLVTPLALIGSVLPMPLSSWVLSGAHGILGLLISVLTWLSHRAFAVWTVPIPSAWLFLFVLAGTLWMLAPKGWPARWLGLFCWIPLALNTPSHPADHEAWVTVFDVGQGSSVLIETRQHRLLYDTGPRYSPEADAGNRIVLPYLNGRGIRGLDALVVTHQDSDHAGGAASILASLKIHTIFSSLPNAAISRWQAISPLSVHRPCRAGQQWEWDGVRFEMLYPDVPTYAKKNITPNERSCVLKVVAGEQAVLLTGDIAAQQEAALIKRLGDRLQSTVLLAPHHGGARTSSAAFLDSVHPAVAVFQVGYRNRYRHPRTDVLARYEKQGIRILRTDESGAVRFVLGKQLEVDAYRQTARRYWQ